MVLLSYRYSYARIQYTVLDKALDSGNKLPLGARQDNPLKYSDTAQKVEKEAVTLTSPSSPFLGVVWIYGTW